MISQIYEKRLRKDLFRLSVVTLITVVFWIGVATYQTITKDRVAPEVKKQILPLTPSLDLDTMNNIERRLVVPRDDWSSLEIATSSGEPVLVEEVKLPSPPATQSAEQ